MEKKYVYLFSEGNKDMRELLGGKGANLAEMTNLGLPVPSGFTITTEACNNYYEQNKTISDEVSYDDYHIISCNNDNIIKTTYEFIGDIDVVFSLFILNHSW